VEAATPYESKKDIMAAVAKSFGIYEATVWLNTPMPELNEETPAEAMKRGNIKDVLTLAKDL